MKAQWPKISILTPSYNQGKYIEQAIASVIDQRYPHFEHIIIDGGSEDNTLSLLNKYPHLKWISEKDRGQSDALNKALGMATGELVGWLNSDDYYAKETFERVRRRFDDDNVDWAILDVVNYYEQTGAEIYMRSPAVTYESLVRNPDIVRQPGTFFRAELLRSLGGWDPDLHMVMDLDLWLRLARVKTPLMVNEIAAYFRIHPEQKTRAELYIRQMREIDRVLQRNGVSAAVRCQYRTKKRLWQLKGRIKKILRSRGLFHEPWDLRISSNV